MILRGSRIPHANYQSKPSHQMETTPEVLETQPTPEVAIPIIEEVKITQTELDDLKHKAGVSSQNFERLKKAEAEIEELRNKLSTNEVPLETEDETIGRLRTEVSSIKEKLNRSEVLETYPALKEVWNEFESFHAEDINKGMNIKTAAKAFLVEKGLLEPPRKGLEKPTGGKNIPLSSLNIEEIKKLRETDYKKYREMVKKGQIKV